MKAVVAEQAKAEAPARPGLYVHVPFCASTCDFCAFYQIVPTAEAIRGFLAGIAGESGLVRNEGGYETIFWGGGTPGLLPPGAIEALAASGAGGRPAPAEWTVELAPASVTAERLAAFRRAGVTRISLGAQSFRPALLEALGRRHTREQILRAVGRIREAGFDNLNLDLMFALPGQTRREWEEDLDAAIALGPEHLSTYCLTFEEDTILWAKLARGRVKLDPEREREFYEAGWDRLGAAGYAQYEISNFARPGRACRHNLNTWAMGDWVGLGPSAASQEGGWRGSNVADLGEWRRRIGEGLRATEDRVALTRELLAEDALIFGLRMNAGVDLGPWKERAPEAPWPEWEARLGRMGEEGLLEWEGSRVRLTRRGRLLADSVAAELMLVNSPA